jgi:hypothetical protein
MPPGRGVGVIISRVHFGYRLCRRYLRALPVRGTPLQWALGAPAASRSGCHAVHGPVPCRYGQVLASHNGQRSITASRRCSWRVPADSAPVAASRPHRPPPTTAARPESTRLHVGLRQMRHSGPRSAWVRRGANRRRAGTVKAASARCTCPGMRVGRSLRLRDEPNDLNTLIHVLIWLVQSPESPQVHQVPAASASRSCPWIRQCPRGRVQTGSDYRRAHASAEARRGP